ncbi:sulfate permease, SulP family [Friedmanniella luteola]|uniref:Sulfate permease, SulP family n=1 Tax=Friedmanniella luteola TaxID=546871 RepID=A0A1H1RS03_9ACTN|nr:sulfate permease [Friedmanniella luteola]SDS37809.1 sulfate permease, SulP family [Friedmanniella luteola]
MSYHLGLALLVVGVAGHPRRVLLLPPFRYGRRMAGRAPPPRSRLQRLTPGLWQLGHYERSWLRGDLLAGVTVAAYLVPQVMAYAVVAGLPAVVGLWAVLGPLAVYAVLGSSRQLSVGPESSTALMTAVAVGALVTQTRQPYAEVAAALALAVGGLCLVFWVCRLGFVANLLSRPVLVGYMAGIAVLMVISQLGKVTGIDVDGTSVLAQLDSFVSRWDQLQLPTTLLAAAVLGLLLLLQWRVPGLPGPLIAMLLAALAVRALDLQERGVVVIGSVPRGVPVPALPALGGLPVGPVLLAALSLTVVAYSDNVVTARAFAARRHETIDSDQEFLALGAANLASALTHGFPVSSSGSRTVLGDAMGSRTQLYSLVALVAVLVTVTFLGPVIAAFPTAALGAVIVYAATRLVDVAELRRLRRFRRSELVLSLATTGAVLAFDVLYGVLVAVGLSVLDLLRRISAPHDGVLGYVPGIAGMHDVDDYPASRQVPGLVVYRYDSPLFFANADNFRRRALAAVDSAATPVAWFLLNAEANVELDLTAADALDELRQTLADRGVVFAMARVKHEVREVLEGTGFVDAVGTDRIFMTLPTAVDAYRAWCTTQHGPPPPEQPGPPVGPTGP